MKRLSETASELAGAFLVVVCRARLVVEMALTLDVAVLEVFGPSAKLAGAGLGNGLEIRTLRFEMMGVGGGGR